MRTRLNNCRLRTASHSRSLAVDDQIGIVLDFKYKNMALIAIFFKLLYGIFDIDRDMNCLSKANEKRVDVVQPLENEVENLGLAPHLSPNYKFTTFQAH